MKIRLFCAVAALTIVMFQLSPPLSAQWLNYKTPGIPRTADGKLGSGSGQPPRALPARPATVLSPCKCVAYRPDAVGDGDYQ